MLDNMIIKVKNKKQKKMLLDWKDKIRNSERNNSVFKNGKCKHYRSKEMSLLVHKPM